MTKTTGVRQENDGQKDARQREETRTTPSKSVEKRATPMSSPLPGGGRPQEVKHATASRGKIGVHVGHCVQVHSLWGWITHGNPLFSSSTCCTSVLRGPGSQVSREGQHQCRVRARRARTNQNTRAPPRRSNYRGLRRNAITPRPRVTNISGSKERRGERGEEVRREEKVLRGPTAVHKRGAGACQRIPRQGPNFSFGFPRPPTTLLSTAP